MLICFYTLQVIATTSLATPLLSPTLPSAAHLIHTNNSAATDTPTLWHSEPDVATERWKRVTKSGIIELLSQSVMRVHVHMICVQYACICVCSTAMSACVNLRFLALLQMRPDTAGDRSSASLPSILPRCSLSFLFLVIPRVLSSLFSPASFLSFPFLSFLSVSFRLLLRSLLSPLLLSLFSSYPHNSLPPFLSLPFQFFPFLSFPSPPCPFLFPCAPLFIRSFLFFPFPPFPFLSSPPQIYRLSFSSSLVSPSFLFLSLSLL